MHILQLSSRMQLKYFSFDSVLYEWFVLALSYTEVSLQLQALLVICSVTCYQEGEHNIVNQILTGKW